MTNITIAIADDHTLVRQALADHIGRQENFEVLFQAPNGKVLIDYLADCPPLPDICILDISMPVMDGYKTLVHIKKNWPDIKVLILSMYVTEFNILRMLRAGASGMISKDEGMINMVSALTHIQSMGYCDSKSISQQMLLTARRKSITQVRITDKELDFLKLCASELTYIQIAAEMGVGKRTVDSYRESLFEKLEISSRTGLAIFAIQSGLVMI